MKHGIVFLAALLLAAMVFTPAYADTKLIAGQAIPAAGPGVDVAVDADDGKVWVSYVSSATQFKVQSSVDGGATWSPLISAGSTVGSLGSLVPLSTAIALWGKHDSPVVAVATDTGIEIWIQDTATSTLRLISAMGVLNGRVNAVDILANDSTIVVMASIRAAQALGDSGVFAWTLRTTDPNGLSLDRNGAQADTQKLLLANVADIQIAEAVVRKLDKTTDTGFTYYFMANAHDTGKSPALNANVDSGIVIGRVVVTTDTIAMTGITTINPQSTLGGGTLTDTFLDAVMSVDQEDGSDTVDRVTVLISVASARGADTLIIIELDDDSNSVAKNIVGYGPSFDTLVVSDTYIQVDTGLKKGTIGSALAASLAFIRSGGTLGMIYVSDSNGVSSANLYSATTGFSKARSTAVSWSLDTVGTNIGYSRNDFLSLADSTVDNFEELSQTVVGGVLHVVGYNTATDQIFYTTLSLGGETKKKDSAVCLMERLFGKTSLRAAFPGLKTFRDTLLGTDMGRKFVSVYYSF